MSSVSVSVFAYFHANYSFLTELLVSLWRLGEPIKILFASPASAITRVKRHPMCYKPLYGHGCGTQMSDLTDLLSLTFLFWRGITWDWHSAFLQFTLANQPDHCSGGGGGGGGQDSLPGLDLSGGSIDFSILVGHLANVLPGLPAEDATLGEAAGEQTHYLTALRLSKDLWLLFFVTGVGRFVSHSKLLFTLLLCLFVYNFEFLSLCLLCLSLLVFVFVFKKLQY